MAQDDADTTDEAGGTRVPGIACPECQYFLQISIADLLSGAEIRCPICGHVINPDRGT